MNVEQSGRLAGQVQTGDERLDGLAPHQMTQGPLSRV